MKRAWRPPAVKTFRPSPLVLIALLGPLVSAEAPPGRLTPQPSPAPSPFLDATPGQRGAVNITTQQFKGAKVDSDVHTVVADAGAAYASTCVPRVADLGGCPPGNVLQCVLDAGWFGCQSDGGWAQLSSGGAVDTSGLVDKTSAQSISGRKVFAGGLDAVSVDAGSVLTVLVHPASTDSTLSLLGTLAGSTGAIDVVLGSANARTGGDLVTIRQGSTDVVIFDHAGNTSLNTVNATSYLQGSELFTPYWFAGGISGATVISSRTHGDPSPDLYVEGPRDPGDPIDGTAPAFLLQENGHALAFVMVNGQFMGGSQYAHAAFKQTAGSGSGAVTLESQDNGYVVILGRLADTHAFLPDGGHPAADGGEWVVDPGDGGTYFDYAGLHGNTTLTGVGDMQFPLQILNHTKVGGDDKLFIDPYGGISQPGSLQRASFPALVVNVATSVGQYFYGALESTLLYASDTHRWYHMLDSGTWAKLLTDQDNLSTQINGYAGGTLDGYWPGGSGHAVNVVRSTLLQHPIIAGSGYNNGVIGMTIVSQGSVGGTFDLSLVDTTASATLCSKTSNSCTAAVGAIVTGCASGIGAAAAGHTVELRIDTTNCTGNNPSGAVFTDW